MIASAPWQQDKAWSDRFVPELKRICGEYLIGTAPHEEDAEHNTDLIVLSLPPVRIACRVRRFQYAGKYDARGDGYADQFTIREGRPSGRLTELSKIVQGWGDYFLYAFSDEAERGLCAWTLADLKVFRLWFNRQLVAQKGQLPGRRLSNGDGSSCFRAFRVGDLPAAFVVGRKRFDGLLSETF